MADISPEIRRIQEVAYHIEELSAQHDSTLQQVVMLKAAIDEHDQAVKALDSLEGVKEGKEILVPLGASSYVYATVARSDAVLMGLGAGVSVDRNVSDAKSTLDDRRAEIEEAVAKLNEGLNKLRAELTKLQNEYSALQDQLRQG